MQTTVKISADLVLNNEQEALELLNKSINDESEEFYITGCGEGLSKCNNMVVNEIATSQDGVDIELYKPNVVNYQYIKTSRKTLIDGDLLIIDGIGYNIVCTFNKYNLFSLAHNKVYFELEITSIQEISELLVENSVEYELYKLV
ncbi:hypothetical protein M3649_03695 [Ureibacillus chungkukjangi]|uniref:hypothetical protein n=1 Tax=Ureibacillus chungkukjangi TaxID=1202712 RepID=UPI00203FCF3F|nr:hypothetical protein [Ureibacillus chungkukjangi]MCM3387234.1 hypothetical protein [Ureibacillus chungkukjangi]